MQTDVSSEKKDPYEILCIPPFTMERLIELSHQRFGEISHYYFGLSQSDR
jgi:hypothetical protein